ncbi:MAG: PAS-domain containing protein [Sulfitobacter sp.]
MAAQTWTSQKRHPSHRSTPKRGFLEADANLKLEERVKQRIKEVMTAQPKMIDAIGATAEGFAFFDADDHLVLHNERYQTLLYGSSEIEIRPGMAFEEIVRTGINRGLIDVSDTDVETFVANASRIIKTPVSRSSNAGATISGFRSASKKPYIAKG